MNYYKIPIDIPQLLQGRELPGCSLKESIRNTLELIIMTKFGEHRHDPSFGCEVWDLDFEMIVSENRWEETLRQSLLRSLTMHEKRLVNIELEIEINDIAKYHLLKQSTEIKKMVDIHLTATIQKTGESFLFNDSLFLSPLSMD